MGGSYMNYYMWQGGSNFGRTSGGPLIVTSYDYDGCLDEYGVIREPKYTHTTRLHAVLNAFAQVLMGYNCSLPTVLGNGVELYTFGPINATGSVAFLRGTTGNTVTVTFNGASFTVNGNAVLVVDGLVNTVLYDSNDISDIPIPPPQTGLPSTTTNTIVWYPEPIGQWASASVVARGPIEQLSLTHYTSIYLWYSTPVIVTQQQIDHGSLQLGLSNAGDYEYFYIDDNHVGNGFGAGSLYEWTLPLSNIKHPGNHTLNILSLTQGLNNYPLVGTTISRGLNGAIYWDTVNLTTSQWSHQPGTLGEYFRAYTDAGQKAIPWKNSSVPSGSTMIWYKLDITTPRPVGDSTRATWQFDMSAMGKGELWVNGFMVGAYWSIKDGSGQYSQRYYHVPRDYLFPPGQSNLVVILEELQHTNGSDPSKVVLKQRNAIGTELPAAISSQIN